MLLRPLLFQYELAFTVDQVFSIKYLTKMSIEALTISKYDGSGTSGLLLQREPVLIN